MELTEPQRTPGLSLILPSSVLSLINVEICCPDPLIFSDLTVSCWLLPLPVCLVPGRQLFSRPVQPVVLLPVSTAPLLARRDSLLDRVTAKGRERSQKAAENVQSARESTRSGTAGQRLDLRTKETWFVFKKRVVKLRKPAKGCEIGPCHRKMFWASALAWVGEDTAEARLWEAGEAPTGFSSS